MTYDDVNQSKRTPDGSHWYCLLDGLGSVVAVINSSGSTVANRYGYDAYGKSTYKSESVTNPWQYASGYLDSTGLTKFGTRYYDPGAGRWTQRGPLEWFDCGAARYKQVRIRGK
jgi:RHS repeat-associated protein